MPAAAPPAAPAETKARVLVPAGLPGERMALDRFRSGKLTTGYIAEEFPEGFHGLPPSERAETSRCRTANRFLDPCARCRCLATTSYEEPPRHLRLPLRQTQGTAEAQEATKPDP